MAITSNEDRGLTIGYFKPVPHFFVKTLLIVSKKQQVPLEARRARR